MTTEVQNTDKDVAPAVIAEPAAQLTHSPKSPNERVDLQVEAKPEDSQPESGAVWSELDDALEGLGGAVAVMEELITETYAGITPHERDIKLKKLRQLLQTSYREIDDAIALNKKLDEERSQLDKIAQDRGYRGFEAMCAAHGFVKVEDQSSEESSPVGTPAAQAQPQGAEQPAAKSKAERNRYPNVQTVYEFLAYPDHHNYEWGYTQSLRSLTDATHPWAKRDKDGKPDDAYFRKATEQEIAVMKERRAAQIAEIDEKRKARAAKKK